jgi:hypothetical protein
MTADRLPRLAMTSVIDRRYREPSELLPELAEHFSGLWTRPYR